MHVADTTTPVAAESETDIPKSLRVPPELDARVGEVSVITGLRKPDVYRLAIKLGVESVLSALRPASAPLSTEEVAP